MAVPKGTLLFQMEHIQAMCLELQGFSIVPKGTVLFRCVHLLSRPRVFDVIR